VLQDYIKHRPQPSAPLDLFADGVGELRRGRGAAEIAGPHAAAGEHALEGRADPIRARTLADVSEHEQARQEQGGRIGEVLVRRDRYLGARDSRLAGRVALISGGAQGIGRAIAFL